MSAVTLLSYVSNSKTLWLGGELEHSGTIVNFVFN